MLFNWIANIGSQGAGGSHQKGGSPCSRLLLAGFDAYAGAIARLTIFCCISALALILTNPTPALASIHTYPEPAQQTTMYRSRLSLRDDQDLAWQTILFKRVKDNQVTEFNLRLISFPGQLTLSHPQGLVVQQSSSNWELADETLLDPQLQSVNSSLAQYNAMPLLQTLDHPAPLTLTVSLDGQNERQLLVPPYVVKEWIQLREMPLG